MLWKSIILGFGMLIIAQPLSAQNSVSNDQSGAALSENRDVLWLRQVVRKLHSTMVDPDSVKVVLPFGFTPLVTWRIWGAPTTGYFTCGVFNARNRMGGYVGATVFVAVRNEDGSISITTDSQENPILARTCEQKRLAGELPSIDPAVLKAITSN